jgi:hypothetical protein
MRKCRFKAFHFLFPFVFCYVIITENKGEQTMCFSKKLTAVIFILVIALPVTAAANDTVNVTIDGQAVVFIDGQGAESVEGRTLVPVRGVFEMLGFDVDWDNDTRTAVLTKAENEIRITIYSNIFTINGAPSILDVPARIIGGRTMVPIRLPLEAVGFTVDWDIGTRTVLIYSSQEEPPQTAAPAPAPSFSPITGHEMMERLGAGINLGNAFDARVWGELHNDYNPNHLIFDHMESQYTWGEPLIIQWDLEAIAKTGFDHVRIPITWETHLDANGRIYDAWINRVQEVVDWALEAGFYAVINTHHERSAPTSLKVLIDKDDTAGAEAWLTNIWTQVAERFKDYPETLLFETMNEPYRAYRGGWIWDWSTGRGVLDSELAKRINHYNNFALNIIRNSGGFNDRRVVINAVMGADPEALPYYEHTHDDPYTMLGVFFYPTHGNHLGNITKALSAGIPIYIKETAPIMALGGGELTDMVPQALAAAWITEFYGKFAEMGIPIAYWNHRGTNGWQIFNRVTGEWNMPLVNAVFAAYGKTAGQALQPPVLTSPHELPMFFDGDHLIRLPYVLLFNTADKIVVEHTGELSGFAFVHMSPPAWNWTQYDQGHERITQQDGRITFDLSGIEAQHVYIFAIWERDDWFDQITRIYLDVS